ncbi:MAG: aldo/keto reductase [Saprospiraceae bacterium]|jgi:aryl-alcohol dehydrogenase-like predicted oxidoreductase|nr:aldo/keto reductase [Saprospiraceae bacterium]
MNYRQFGRTDLRVSEIGFGAWGIAGPAMAGDIPIGWGKVDDTESKSALRAAFDQGVNFYDTADFYGFGHSEKLLGEVFGNRPDVIIASKVGQRLGADDSIQIDYSRAHILQACEDSLRRLKRDQIEFYQLHVARMQHLESGECITAMQDLQQAGKIRYWGISLNTFAPEPEGTFFMDHQLGHGFQLVLNLINQKAIGLMRAAAQQGYGIIARMPFQFGLLTGKLTRATTFERDDHRMFRLTPDVLQVSLDTLEPIWDAYRQKYQMTPLQLALRFILSFPEISTVIPGIKTVAQAQLNTSPGPLLSPEDHEWLQSLYASDFEALLKQMQGKG